MIVTYLFTVLMVFHLPGSDGVFDINSTTGCITVTTYPSLLRKELYEIKVKVKKKQNRKNPKKHFREMYHFMLYLNPLPPLNL